MLLSHRDIRRVMSVLLAALLVVAFVTPVCVTMACSMSVGPSATPNLLHLSRMALAQVGGPATMSSGAAHGSMVSGSESSDSGVTGNNAASVSLGDSPLGGTSHSGLIGIDAVALALLLLALSALALIDTSSPLASTDVGALPVPLREPPPPPPLDPRGERLTI